MTEICEPIKSYEPLNKTSFALQDHVLKTGAILVFHCHDKITKKIKGLKTVTGHELVEEKRNDNGHKELHIWNEKTQSRDVQEEIFSNLDRESGAQFSAYYDKENNRVSFNFGGTDFTNPNDLKSAAQTMTGSVDMRMTKVKENIAAAMQEFKERYPDKIKETSIDLFAHSSGANALPLANYFLRREHGIEPRSQVVLDPFGVKNAVDNVSQMIAPSDIGQMKDGQPVKIKVSAYDFSRYDNVNGTLENISASTFQTEKKESFYKAKIKLDQNYVGSDPSRNLILPGMTVQAGIITGEKTILQYLLKPLQVAKESAFHEH